MANQLIEARLGDGSTPLFVHIDSAGVAGRRSVEEHPERSRRFWTTHHEVGISRVEAERDASIPSVQHAHAPLDRPVPGERPLVEHQHVGQFVRGSSTGVRASPGREALALRVAKVRLR